MASNLVQSAWKYPYDTYDNLYLECFEKGSRKFYEMKNTGAGKWSARWGKIGTEGQAMGYAKGLWATKLAEKLKKKYILERAISTSSASRPIGTPPPVVTPRKPDPQILTDATVMAKIDRIILFLEERGNSRAQVEFVEEMKLRYIKSGKLTKSDMETLNKTWIINGGGKW